MGIQRIVDIFEECRQKKNLVFLAYLTAGFESAETTIAAMIEVEKRGANVIEIGVPFSDPLADGPTIQESHAFALEKNQIKIDDCFEIVKESRKQNLKIPVLLMSYINPLVQYGLEKICQKSQQVGVDGFIVVDVSPEDLKFDPTHMSGSEPLGLLCQRYDLSLVPLIAPTSPLNRLKEAVSIATSFIYVVSVNGVTGVREASSWISQTKELKTVLAELRNFSNLPFVIGFGVSDSHHVQHVSELGANGFVVGSELVKCLKIRNSEEDMSSICGRLADVCRKLNYDRSVKGELLPLSVSYNNGSSVNENNELRKKEISKWYFGNYGGRYIPETLMYAHDVLFEQFSSAIEEPKFVEELDFYRRNLINGPTPIYYAKRLTEECGGAQIWFKREELAHTGSHKINNALGQSLLAKRLGKSRIIAETGAGQHGVATATACAFLNLKCVVYMGAVDIERQKLNVFRMKMLGAEVVSVRSGSQTLKDAVNEALRDWVTNVRDTHYIIGSAIGPHPFPDIVRYFQSVIGKEARAQMLLEGEFQGCGGPGRLPDCVVACVGGGSNAIGIFSGFFEDKEVQLIGVEAGGVAGPPGTKHCASLSAGTVGVFHGNRTFIMQDKAGQISETHSISAGLDYPGVGPQHAALKDSKRAEYVWATDEEALSALQICSKMEGIIPALEPSHALAHSMKLASKMTSDQIVLVNVCGRGDKDMSTVAKALGVDVS